MDLWLAVLLFILALASLGVAIYLIVGYIRRSRLPKAPPPPPEDPNDLTLMEGIGLDEGTLVGDEIDLGGLKPPARLRYTTRGIAHDILLDRPVTNIGRGTGNEIDVGDALASRRHARILLDDDGEYWLEDGPSANHTYLNGTAITREKLSRDDQIRIGETVMTFVRDRGVPPPRAG